MLKIAVEERLGYPVELISDGLVRGIESVLNLTDTASVYAALAAGTADIYPEVRPVACACMHLRALPNGGNGGELTGYEADKPASQAWLSEEMEEYEAHVRQAGDVRKLLARSYLLCTICLFLVVLGGLVRQARHPWKEWVVLSRSRGGALERPRRIPWP